MSGLEDELIGTEELDYEFDIDEEEREALLARAKLHEDVNDAIDIGVKEVLQDFNEAKNEEEANIQPQDSAGTVHSRLGPRETPTEDHDYQQDENDAIDQNEEAGYIQPAHSASSVHSRLGPRESPTENNDYHQEEFENKQELHDDYQKHVVSEEFKGDEEESPALGDEKEDNDEEDEEEEDEDDEDDSRRRRFKSERFKSERSTSLSLAPTTTKLKRDIPDSLDEVITKNNIQIPNENSGNRGRGGRGGRGWRGRGGRGMPWGPGPGGQSPIPSLFQNERYLMNGPPFYEDDRFLMNRPNFYEDDRFMMNGPDFYGSRYPMNNGGLGAQQLQYENSPRPMASPQQNRSSIWARLGNKAGDTMATAQQAGGTPAGAQTTTLLKRPHADNAATNTTTPVKQMKYEIPPGKNAVSILHEQFRGRIKFVEKSIGNIHVPEFECSVEVDGQSFKGLGKQKKAAKNKAAETALLALMQNVPINNDEIEGQQLQNQNSSAPMTAQENQAFQNIQQKVLDAKTSDTTVASSHTGSTATVAPQNGSTTPYGKDITHTEAQTTTLHQSPHVDIAATDDAVLELPPGKNAISVLNEMYLTKIKYIEKKIGDVHTPEFECSVVVEGQTFIGLGKQKKVAKKNVAETVLLDLMQNWSKGILPGPGAPQHVLKQLMDACLKQEQEATIPQEAGVEP